VDEVDPTKVGGHLEVDAAQPRGTTRGISRSALVVAAATLLVIAGIVVVATVRGDDTRVIGTSTTAVTIATSSSPVVAAATATPSIVAPLQLLTIAPSDPVNHCQYSQITVAVAEQGHLRQVGLIDPDGSYLASPAPAIECEGSPPLDAPRSLRAPPALEAGDYVFCLAGLAEPAGCAPISIRLWAESCFASPIAPPGLPDGSAPGSATPNAEGTAVIWGTGPTAIGQVVGARPDATWLGHVLVEIGRAHV
jgi:hypothetical protein